MSKLASAGVSEEKHEAPRLEVSVLEAMVETLCSRTMVKILLITHRKGFMLGKETGGGGERVSMIQMSVSGRDGTNRQKKTSPKNSGACGLGHFTQGKTKDMIQPRTCFLKG